MAALSSQRDMAALASRRTMVGAWWTALVRIVHGARGRIVPSLSDSARRPGGSVRLHELDVAKLLGREEVRLDVAVCARYLEGHAVLVTGAVGSIGWELCHQLAHLRPSRLVLLDMNETGLFDLHASLHAAGACCDLVLCIADVSDEDRIAQVFAQHRPQVVFHAAAYKHVPLLEEHPAEAVKANVLGTAVLCRAAHTAGVERFVFVSSDKAVGAANNLGYSKRIGELLMRAYGQSSRTIFCAVRFGNVIGSRGSVVPTFERQIAAGGPVTVTDPAATRFFMSIPEAAGLVIEAAANAVGGAIFMLDMGQPVSIVGLAEKMIRLRGLRLGIDVEIVYTGLRPGEKLHEELTSALEATLATRHLKIMEVIDPRPVSRVKIEAAVRTLADVARQAAPAQVSAALRLVAQGQPLGLPAPFPDDARPTRTAPADILAMSDAPASTRLPLPGGLAAYVAARTAEHLRGEPAKSRPVLLELRRLLRRQTWARAYAVVIERGVRSGAEGSAASTHDAWRDDQNDHRVVDFAQRRHQCHELPVGTAHASLHETDVRDALDRSDARASPRDGDARASSTRPLARDGLEIGG